MLTDFQAFRSGDAFPSHILHWQGDGERPELTVLIPLVTWRWGGALRFAVRETDGSAIWFVGHTHYPLSIVPTTGERATVYASAAAVPAEEARALMRARWPHPPHHARRILCALTRHHGHGDIPRAVRDQAAGEAIAALQRAGRFS